MSIQFNGDVLIAGRDVLVEEADALLYTASLLDDQFVKSVDAILSCKGRIVVSGIGKSGHVGRKIAATFASTGTPSFFIHSGEAGHGDLGMFTDNDLLIALSNSGETEEVVSFVHFVKRLNAKTISITSNPLSSLGKLTDLHLSSSVKSEACPLGIAPTTSTTVQLAIGDAISVAVLAKRGFSTEDFAKTHPLGALGKRYYTRVRDVMQPISEIPHLLPSTSLRDAIPDMAIGRAGAVLVMENDDLKGIFTDSDLRRVITNSTDNFDSCLVKPISNFMTANPLTLDINNLATSALTLFEQKRISRIICVDQKRVVGLLGWHNLLHHKVA